MYVEIIQEYNDTKMERLVIRGETLTVEDKRGHKLIQSKVAKQIEELDYKPRKTKTMGDFYGTSADTE